MNLSAHSSSRLVPQPQLRGGVVAPSVLALSGWVCDRYTAQGMQGAGLLARRAAAWLDAPFRQLGEPEQAVDLGWQASLAKAAPYLSEVSSAVEAVMAEGRRPLIFANRCGASIATIAAALRQRPDATIVWCDAHGDFNTPASTPTGYLGGMVLTALCGLWDSGLGAGLAPERIVLVGQRDLDDAEAALIERHGVRLIAGHGGIVDPDEVASAVNGAPIWLHIDTDVVDPIHLPAEYRVDGGLHPGAVRHLFEKLFAQSELVGFELTEFEAPVDPVAHLEAENAIMRMIEPVLQRCAAENA